MSWAAVGVSAASLVGSYMSSQNNGSTSATQIPLEDPNQATAKANLLDFSRTGTLGNYTAGTPYKGSLGDFGLSSLEQTGQQQVADRLTSGPGELSNIGTGALKDLLTTDKYNPLNQTGMIQGLTGAIDYNTKLASDAARRNSAYTGNLYSTDAIKSLGNVEAQGANTKATTLAGLYQNYIGQKLGAIPQAFGADQQINDEARQKTADAYTYGAIPRALNTAADQAQYGEFQRQQQEKQGQVTAASSVAGSNVPFGVPTVTLPNANPWQDVLNQVAQFGGSYLGAKTATPKVPAAAAPASPQSTALMGSQLPYANAGSRLALY